MTKELKMTLSQLNYTVGDIEGNIEKIITAHEQAHKDGADLVIFSEMATTGYPPEDLVLRPHFQEQALHLTRTLAAKTTNGTAILVGGLWKEGDKLYNAAILLDNGEISHIVAKHDLPNYGVFDEKRLFQQGPPPQPIDFRGTRLGIMICEDMWNSDISRILKDQKAEILITLNGSPFESDKQLLRQDLAQDRVEKTKLPLIYVNQVGGQDELVFEGSSFVYNADAKLAFKAPKWEENTTTLTFNHSEEESWTCVAAPIEPLADKYDAIYEAIKLGLRDYIEKNGFPGVVIGMSGGVDSALTAAIAAHALGKNRVHLVMMPSKYTSEESLADAEECAQLLGLKVDTIEIEPAVHAFDTMLKSAFKGTKPDITEENLQSRIRGNILMALSNKHGYMVLTTGNKSEMAVGYATIYGDMCGGFNALKDLYKTEVYELCRWLNKKQPTIPENILTKAPTAELRPDQTDQDSLPSYEVLDDILIKLIERKMSAKEVAESGYEQGLVDKIALLLKRAEYKRRQAPPGVKITGLAFGRDRRYPITNAFDF